MPKDFVRILQEIRGTGEPEAPATDGIYYDITEKTTDDDNVTARLAPGMYKSMQVMYVDSKLLVPHLDEIAVLAPIAGDIVAVAAIDGEILTLAGLSTEISSLYADRFKLSSLYADKLKLDSLYADKATLDSIYADKTKLDSIYADKATLDSIFADKATLDSLFADKSALDSLYADKITLDRLFASIDEIDRLYLSADNIDATAGAITNIDTVAINVGDVNIVAANILDVNNFADTYYGSLAVAPTIISHPTLSEGDLYFDTVLVQLRVYDGSVWTAAGSTVNGIDKSEQFVVGTPSGIYDGVSTTVFPLVNGYDAGFAVVYWNGVALADADVDITSGTSVSITSTEVPVAGDIIKVVAFGAFVLADHYTKAATDTLLDINSYTAKTTPVDADELALADSAATFSLKKLTWSNLKATLKTYFDTLYGSITWVANDSRAKTALNASGTAPIYACRAWVNFNGTGTVAIRASGNVSSIADNGTGDYTVNFITAMPDINYAPILTSGDDSSSTAEGRVAFFSVSASTTSSFRFRVKASGSNTQQDTNINTVSIFR